MDILSTIDFSKIELNNPDYNIIIHHFPCWLMNKSQKIKNEWMHIQEVLYIVKKLVTKLIGKKTKNNHKIYDEIFLEILISLENKKI